MIFQVKGSFGFKCEFRFKVKLTRAGVVDFLCDWVFPLILLWFGDISWREFLLLLLAWWLKRK